MLTRPPWHVDLYIGEPVRNPDGAQLAEEIRAWMLQRVKK
jgi:hypothetical protein